MENKIKIPARSKDRTVALADLIGQAWPKKQRTDKYSDFAPWH